MKLKILLILLCTAFTSPIFAGAAERLDSVYDVAMKSRNGIGISNVRAANDMVHADITQKVTVDGSNATINTKVSIPANDDSFKRNTAKYAKNLLRGGAYSVAAALAMESLLNGVDYVMGEGGQIQKKPNSSSEESFKYSSPYAFYNSGGEDFYSYSSFDDAAQKYWDRLHNMNPELYESIESRSVVSTFSGREGFYTEYRFIHKGYGVGGKITGFTILRKSNPDYKPDHVPQPTPVSDPEMEDAFFNWFKNNPGSVTDPVTTYIYSGKSSNGTVVPSTPQGTDPSFGQREITDEMMNNYMEHRNANLRNAEKTTVSDSTQTDTSQDPDGSKTTTTTNPDGSKTTTRTDIKTDPDTGEITTTVTETTTMPDGSTSTKTETSTQTKPNPEKTEMSPLCEYAAKLCAWMDKDNEHKVDEKSLWEKITDWFDWTKEEPDNNNDDTEVDLIESKLPNIKQDLFKASGQCPPDFSYPFPLPNGSKHTITYSYSTVCEWFGKLYYITITCAWIAAYMIVMGRGELKNG